MARILTHSFESGSGLESGFATSTATARSGSYSHGETFTLTIPGAPQEIYMMIGFYINGAGSWTFNGSTNTHVTLHWNDDGSVILDVLGTDRDTEYACWQLYKWEVVEIHYKCHDTTGIFEMKKNGVVILSYSGDTRNAQDFTNFYVWGGGAYVDNYFDDIIINDTSGSSNNSWVGVVKLMVIRPNGAGDVTQLTGSSGSSNYSYVDEVPANSADYVYGINPGDRDLYNVESATIPIGATIKNVHVCAAAKMDSGTGSIKGVVKSGGSEFDSDAMVLSDQWKYYSAAFPVNPATGLAWGASDVDNLQIGIKVA